MRDNLTSADSVVNAVKALLELQSVLRDSRDLALRDLSKSRSNEAMLAEENRRLRARLEQYESATVRKLLDDGAG